MENLTPLRYRAFLSYSHKDEGFADALHKWLESYAVPRDLAGKATPFGTAPQRLRPIFRDRHDLEAGQLKSQISAALEASECLIVLCSPHSAASVHVNEEVRGFKALGKSHRVYPIILDGEPGDPERECFPPALVAAVGPDGKPTGETEEPLAADSRPKKDGPELARMKVVAGLLGVDLDDLIKREAHEARRRAIFWRGLAAGFAFLGLLAAASSVFGWYEYRKADAALGREKVALTKETAAHEKSQKLLDSALRHTSQLVDLGTREEIGVPSHVGRRLLGEAEGVIADMTAIDPAAEQLPLAKAGLLMSLSDSLSRLGQADEQKKTAEEALKLIKAEETKKPDDKTLSHAEAKALIRMARVYLVQGELERALNTFAEGRDILAAKLPGVDAGRPEWLGTLSDCHRAIAYVQNRRGLPKEAREAAREALKVAELIDQKDLADDKRVAALVQVADLHRQALQNTQALDAAGQGLAIVNEALAAEPGSVAWRREKSALLIIEGDVHQNLKDRPKAREKFEEALEIRQDLLEADPKNVPLAVDVAWSRVKIGEVLHLTKEWDAAKDVFEKAKESFEELFKAHPNDKISPRLFIDVLDGLGKLRRDQRDFVEMRKIYARKLEFGQRLLEIDPSNRDHKRVICQARVEIGEAYTAEGELELALAEFAEARNIVEALQRAGEASTPDEINLANALEEAGEVLFRKGQTEKAFASFDGAVEMRRRRAERPAAAMGTKLTYAYSLGKVAAARFALGEFPAALEIAEKILAIRRPFANDKDLKATSRQEMANTLDLIGRAKLRLGGAAEALAAFEESRTIREKLVADDEDNAEYRRNLGETWRLIGAAARPEDSCEAAAAFLAARGHVAAAIAGDRTGEEGRLAEWRDTLQTIETSLKPLEGRCGAAPAAASPPPDSGAAGTAPPAP